MENAMTKMDETESTVEVEETSDSSIAGLVFAGFVGGFLAYAVVGGAIKLQIFINKKWTARKQKDVFECKYVVDAEIVEDTTDQANSVEKLQTSKYRFGALPEST